MSQFGSAILTFIGWWVIKKHVWTLKKTCLDPKKTCLDPKQTCLDPKKTCLDPKKHVWTLKKHVWTLKKHHKLLKGSNIYNWILKMFKLCKNVIISIYVLCLSVCLFVSNKRQNGSIHQAQNLLGNCRDPERVYRCSNIQHWVANIFGFFESKNMNRSLNLDINKITFRRYNF